MCSHRPSAAGVPRAACAAGGIRICSAGDRDRIGEWRYALIAGPFEPVQNVTADQLRAAWRAGKIASAFVATRTGASVATGPEIARFMQAKYPIDGNRISIVPSPTHKHHPPSHTRRIRPVAER